MKPLYAATAAPAMAFPALHGEEHADLAVVGAGFTGLSMALHAAEGGASVAVLEAEEPGWGASGRNGGQVNAGLKPDPDQVETDFGSELGRRMNTFAGAAPDVVFALIDRLCIDCEARRNGTLRAAASERHGAGVRVTYEQWARRGAPVELVHGADLERLTGTPHYPLAMLDKRGGDLNPLSFARGLARAAASAGARIYARSRALQLTRDGARWQLQSGAGRLVAPQVLIATNGYSDGLWPGLARSIVPVFGSIAATAPLGEPLARAVMPSRAVLYESGTLTVYYRVDAQGRLLIGGRGPQREITDAAQLSHLTRYAETLWPGLRGVDWTHAWSGQLAMTREHYPHVHEPAPGVVLCLGYNGRGVAMGTALGAALARRMLVPGGSFEMPLSALKPIRGHALWPWAVRLAIAKARLADLIAR